jgi:hypothetical protein
MRWQWAVFLAGAVLALGAGTSPALAGTGGAAQAQGRWLDEPLAQWNSPGMPVPPVPEDVDMPAADPRCEEQQRPVETWEDAAVAEAGWSLFSTYEAGWGVKLIYGLSGYDGMCRPWGFQVFVFVDGVFAGTLSPVPMNSRLDGVVSNTFIQAGGDSLTATFQRYTEDDPLCCPSAGTTVSYGIDRSSGLPVLVAQSARTTPNSP